MCWIGKEVAAKWWMINMADKVENPLVTTPLYIEILIPAAFLFD